MSRSNNVEIRTPYSKTFEWSGSEGYFTVYDKNAEGKTIQQLPFTFLPLDRLHTVSGFSDKDKRSYYANDIRDIKKEPLNVRLGGSTVAKGLYSDIKDALASMGAEYCQTVYVAFKENGTLVIGKLKLRGSSIGSWIEFCKKNDIYKTAVKVSGFTEEKKGAIKYKVPTYESTEVSEETDKEAIELDKQLQEFLSAYFKQPEQPSQPVQQGVESEAYKQANEVYSTAPATTLPSVDDLPF